MAPLCLPSPAGEARPTLLNGPNFQLLMRALQQQEQQRGQEQEQQQGQGQGQGARPKDAAQEPGAGSAWTGELPLVLQGYVAASAQAALQGALCCTAVDGVLERTTGSSC